MRTLLVRAAVALAVVASGVLAVPAASATPPRTFADCMDIAVGENDADPWVAHDACEADSTTACYRIFRDHYGRQQWALDACKARNDQAVFHG